MGSGSSRSLGAQRRRGSHSRGAPEHGPAAAATVAATADAAARVQAPSSAPVAPPDGRTEALRLLDLLLAESVAWGAQAPAESPPEVATGAQAEGAPEHSRASEAPAESPMPATRRSSVSYNRAEEELMASIEREYGC